MPNEVVSALAEAIARDLFTNGSGERAQRLVLELPGKRDGGGWCEEAMSNRIAEHLLVVAALRESGVIKR